jgi:D-alanyl-D-alanine carboxypeptidase
MTRTARALGMNQSTFRNPNGLPNSSQFTTARDMAKLGAALQDRFPHYYKFFSARSFTYKGKKMRNHNRLLGSVAGVDGIKTGYTRASGFNLVSNVKRDGRHIIAVVMGGKTGASRDAHMRDLIAKHLPSAKKGGGKAPLLVADAPAPAESEEIVAGPAEAAEPAEAVETAVAAVAPDARLPRPRPGSEADHASAAAAEPAASREAESALVAYAPAARPRDLVSAAMAQPVAPAVFRAAKAPAPKADPVSARIAAATQVAEVAGVKPQGDDQLARLTRIAKARAGVPDDVIAAPRVRTSDPEAGAGEAGWHIQIGAVPTIEGAQDLIERAQSSMGPVLASRRALTQEVAKDGTTLYRARFAGFVGKDEARNACDKLKSKSFSCLAVRN